MRIFEKLRNGPSANISKHATRDLTQAEAILGRVYRILNSCIKCKLNVIGAGCITQYIIQSGASGHSLGLEDTNVGSSPGLLGQ